MLEKDSVDKLVMKLADNQFLYRLDDSLLWLFNTETGEYWNLNESSYFALSLFDGKRTVGEICKLYVGQYSPSGVSQEVIMEDFKSLIDHLITANVIISKEK